MTDRPENDPKIESLLDELKVSQTRAHGSRLPQFVRQAIHDRVRQLQEEARKEYYDEGYRQGCRDEKNDRS